MASDHEKGAIEFAAMLAELYQEGLVFQKALSAARETGSVHGAIEIVNYANGLAIEAWIELTVNPDHDHIVWNLDIWPGDANWRIESAAYFKHHQTEKQTFFLKEEQHFPSFAAVRDGLPAIVKTLHDTRSEIDRFLARGGRRMG